MSGSDSLSLLDSFAAPLGGPDRLERLRKGVIGEGASFDGPFGPRTIIYADYVASGRALRQIEDFVLERVLPYYANSHTEASYCGGFITRLRRAARATIARICGADEDYATIFAGSGATAGLNRLVHLLGVADAAAQGETPAVFIGPYEHHSNILPWRESGAEVIEIPEGATGGPDLGALEQALVAVGPGRLRVGAFSAASNVTGIVTDVAAVTELLKRHGALAVWDYAGGGPYLPIGCRAGSAAPIDALVVSPHKFIGGPGASGVLIVRRAAVTRTKPVLAGGGTVRFVSPWGHDYSSDLAAREEAGTPNVVGDIRAALCFLVKEAIGQDVLDRRQEELRQRALGVWSRNPNLELLGNAKARWRLPIFSFRVRDRSSGGYLHPQLFTRLLSDCHGIQARGGCACAGPYAHRLMGIDQPASEAIRDAILAGREVVKPGWTRLNLSVLMSDVKADRVIGAVDELSRNPHPFAEAYACDVATARFQPLGDAIVDAA